MKTAHKLSIGSVATLFGIIGTVWAFGDDYGVRPVLKAELDDVKAEVNANTQYRMIERFRYLKIKLEKGGGLTIEEQAEICTLAAILRFKVEICG